MDNIFLIVGGEYSDWYIRGYAESYEEASKICVYHNKLYPDDEWYIEEAEPCKYEFKDSFEVEYVYSYYFALKDGSWNKYRASALGKEKGERVDETSEWSGYAHISANIDFVLDEYNFEKADKVAQDRLYAFLDEHKEEIGGPGTEWGKKLDEERRAELAKQERIAKQQLELDYLTLEKRIQPIVNEAKSRGLECEVKRSNEQVACLWVTFKYESRKTTRTFRMSDIRSNSKAIVDIIEVQLHVTG